jgi:phage terminase small subunit
MGSRTGQRKAGRRKNLPAPSDGKRMVCSTIADDPDKMDTWNFLVGDLEARGLYSPTYTFILQETVETFHLLQECRADITAEGRTIPRYNRDGDVIGVQPNPSFDQAIKLQGVLFRCIKELGLSPASIVFLERTEAVGAADALPSHSDEERPRVVVFR